MRVWAVTSVKVTGDAACGPAGGGVFGKSGAEYARPVRGVGVGAGCCWAMAAVHKIMIHENARKDTKPVSEASCNFVDPSRSMIHENARKDTKPVSEASCNFVDPIFTRYGLFK